MRFLPPLNVSEKEIDEALAILEQVTHVSLASVQQLLGCWVQAAGCAGCADACGCGAVSRGRVRQGCGPV